MAKLRDSIVNNSLNVASGLAVDEKIGNDNIVRPIISVSGTPAARIIRVDMLQFISNSTINYLVGRPKIHWWHSTSRWSYPIILGGGTQTFTLNNGLSLDPSTITNSAILRTSLTDSSHIFQFTITNGNDSTETTYYFMCSVQGIVYSSAFTLYTTAG